MSMRPTLALRHPRPAPSRPTGAAQPAAAFAASAGNALFDSGALLRGCREILIRHGGETYRLRHTRNDKLILTK